MPAITIAITIILPTRTCIQLLGINHMIRMLADWLRHNQVLWKPIDNLVSFLEHGN